MSARWAKLRIRAVDRFLWPRPHGDYHRRVLPHPLSAAVADTWIFRRDHSQALPAKFYQLIKIHACVSVYHAHCTQHEESCEVRQAEGDFAWQMASSSRVSRRPGWAPPSMRENFSDLHPPLDRHEALVESDRCYFCHDAPCMNACPTSIDIPLFIREISTGNPLGAAKTIFDQNIFGGMCARVCPTETLCEEVCVREVAEGKPVKIGQLQRYATDIAMREGKQFYERAAPTGKKVAVVGAGPAGLCLRPPPRHARPCRRRLRGARQARRPQRIRHRRLQDDRTVSRRPRWTTSCRSAASRSTTARRSAAT